MESNAAATGNREAALATLAILANAAGTEGLRYLDGVSIRLRTDFTKESASNGLVM